MAGMSALGQPAAPPPLRRDREDAVLGGVCAGFGRRLGIDPIVLRVVFIAAAAAGGLGVIAYGLAWALMPAEGASRVPALRVPGGPDSWSVATGIGMLMLAVLLLFREWGLWVGDALVWPVVLAAAGGALIWRQSATAADPAPARAEPRRSGGSALGRAALGVALVVGAALIFLYFNDALRPARDVLLPVVVVLVAGTLILAPWWIRLVRGLADERAERVRSQERAELAAHLHDSVLQTLALMQRQADNPREVAGLARRQERELRAWLNGGRPFGERSTLAAALELAAAEAEEDARRRGRRRGRRRLPARRRRGGARRRRARGDRQRRQVRRAAPGLGVRRDRRRARRGVRARPRPRLRPRDGARRPPRRARVDRGAHAPPRRRRQHPHRGGRPAPRSS